MTKTKQGFYVEYDRANGRLVYEDENGEAAFVLGSDDVENDSTAPGDTVTEAIDYLVDEPVLTKFIAGTTRYPTLQSALSAAGAVATANQWAVVEVRPGVYNEGTIVFPPYVRLVGSSDFFANQFSTPGQSWLIGGFDCNAAGERAITNFSIRRNVGDADPCIEQVCTSSNELYLDNVNLVHQDAESALVMEGVAGGFSLVQAVRSLFYGNQGSATPVVDIRATAFLDCKSCWIWVSESGANQLAVRNAFNFATELCNVIGQVELTDTGIHNDVCSTFQSLFGACMNISALGSFGQYLPSFFWGVGNDIIGNGSIYGCGTIRGWSLSLAGTLTIVDAGARDVYVPTAPADWGSSVPDTHKDALDTLAANVVIP